mmetsp:Transcript_29976/g.91778  ORF Transcript_29976/g.91778 Transcript_29976/m.91778 type:complete len:285 (-) Transcript_29976:57-911(-)
MRVLVATTTLLSAALLALRRRTPPPTRRVLVEEEEVLPGGIVLWAFGRSATDTFAGTTVRTAGWRYCRGEKEAFKTTKPSARKLRNCVAHAERFVHVKPYHIHNSPLANQTTFFAAARDAGFTVVAASYRENALARAVSSYELNVLSWTKSPPDKKARQTFCTGKLTESFQKDRLEYESGIRAARSTPGLQLIELSFTDVTVDLCESTHRTLSLISQPLGRRPCKVFYSQHTKTSHHQASLAERIGPDAAACVERDLRNHSKFAWMLDVHREDPPYRSFFDFSP